MIAWACTVRGCAQPLVRGARVWSCTRGHAFDVAREGYVNLLQPQDRRSLDAGDSKESVVARRSLLDAGLGAALIEGLSRAVSRLGFARRDGAGAEDATGVSQAVPSVASSGAPRAVDLGCGEGTHLAALAERFGFEAAGIDLSPHAISAAARRHPRHAWVVANADRVLPLADGAVDLVFSVDGRRAVSEAWRVLAPGGAWIVAVSAHDDLAELRASVLGAADSLDRGASVVAEAGPWFDCIARERAAERRRLDARELAWLAAATYRCARAGERRKLEELDGLDVTLAHDVLTLRKSASDA